MPVPLFLEVRMTDAQKVGFVALVALVLTVASCVTREVPASSPPEPVPATDTILICVPAPDGSPVLFCRPGEMIRR